MMCVLVSSLSCKCQGNLNMKLTCGWKLLTYDGSIVCAKHGFILHEVVEPEEGGGDNCNLQWSSHSVSFVVCLESSPWIQSSRKPWEKAADARPRNLCPKEASHMLSSQEAETDTCSNSACFLHLHRPGYQQGLGLPYSRWVFLQQLR